MPASGAPSSVDDVVRRPMSDSIAMPTGVPISAGDIGAATTTDSDMPASGAPSSVDDVVRRPMSERNSNSLNGASASQKKQQAAPQSKWRINFSLPADGDTTLTSDELSAKAFNDVVSKVECRGVEVQKFAVGRYGAAGAGDPGFIELRLRFNQRDRQRCPHAVMGKFPGSNNAEALGGSDDSALDFPDPYTGSGHALEYSKLFGCEPPARGATPRRLSGAAQASGSGGDAAARQPPTRQLRKFHLIIAAGGMYHWQQSIIDLASEEDDRKYMCQLNTPP
jgi:hypothetical protein